MSGGLLSGTHDPAGVPGRNLAARELLVTPKGNLPKPSPAKRVSKTTYPATSGMGALAAKTGGSYAFDRPPQRPDDIKVLQHAAQHSPGVKAIAEMTRDPLGLLQAGGAIKDVVKHPGVGTGVAAGISVAGLALPGIRKAKIVEEAPILRAVKSLNVKLRPDEAKALQVVHEGVPIEKRIADQKALVESLRRVPGGESEVPLPHPSLAEQGKIPAVASSHGSDDISAVVKGTKPAALLEGKDIVRAKEKGLLTKSILVPGDDFTYHLAAKSHAALSRLEAAVRLGMKADVETAQEAAATGRALGYSEADIAKYIEANNLPSHPGLKLKATATSAAELKAAQKELSSLQAASKHVHDVNGMPRLLPGRHKLVETYAQAERKLAKEAPRTPKDQLVGAMRGAKVARGKQNVMYSEERAARFAKAEAHLQNTELPPEERIRLAKGELRGELPKINFKGFNELSPEALAEMRNTIHTHPLLSTGQKIHADAALTNALEGKVPQPSQIALLEHVFGKETTAGLSQLAKHPLRENLLRVLNIPRSLMASFDVSAPMRQGLVALTRHPVISAKNFGPMLKSMKSEDYFQNNVIGNIEKRPTYPLMLQSKLAITKLGSDVGAREERFPTDLAEKIPVVGRGVRGSGRAYNGYLDKTRADIFDHLIQKAQSQGTNIHNEKFLKGLGSLINNTTGRGDLGEGALQEAGKFLNTFFFSPRLLASRVNIIASPIKYAKADPFVRKEALKTWFSLAGTLTTVIGLLSQIPGVKVETDPRNPDWGKVRLGNTRVDLAGGFQQPLRLAAQLATGVAISSTTGKKENLTAGGFGQPTRLDIALRFFEGKESPAASLVTDWARNGNQVGQKFSWKSAIGQRVTPLLLQDVKDLYNSKHGGVDGITAAFGGYALGSTGVGLQTYGPNKPKPKGSSKTPFSSPGLVGGSSGGFSGGGLLSTGG